MTDNKTESADAIASAKPKSVRQAVLGMVAVAGIGLVQGVNALAERSAYNNGIDEVSKTVNHEQIIAVTGNLRGSVLLASVLGVLALVAVLPLAGLVNIRKRWARTVTAIVAILLIMGEVVLMAADSSSVKTGNFIREPDVAGGSLATVEAMNRILVPSWFVPLHYLTEFGVLAATIFVLVHLFRAPTNDFFMAGHEKVIHADNTWSVAQVRRDDEQ